MISAESGFKCGISIKYFGSTFRSLQSFISSKSSLFVIAMLFHGPQYQHIKWKAPEILYYGILQYILTEQKNNDAELCDATATKMV